MANYISHAPSTRTVGRSSCKISTTWKARQQESYGKVQRSAGEGRHDICGMPGVLGRSHDDGESPGSPVEGNLKQKTGVA